MASEPSGEITGPLAGNAPVATGTTDAATNPEIKIAPEPLGKPVMSGEGGKTNSKADTEKLLKNLLELARNLRHTRLASEAEPVLVELLGDGNPDSIRQPALLELALCAQDQ